MPFEIGDILLINCSAPRGKPAVDIGFTLQSATHSFIFQPVSREQGPKRMISQELTVTLDLHLRTIMCDVTSGLSFPGQRLQCSIGPIQVYQPVGVTVMPSETTLRQVGDSVMLSCLAEGYPDVFSFAWACFPPGYVEGCNVRKREANFSVHCSAGENPNDIEAEAS